MGNQIEIIDVHKSFGNHQILKGVNVVVQEGLGIDALEDEAQYFSGKWTENPLAQRLLAFENVIITPHIAYFTDLAVREIVETALDNAVAIINKEENLNIVA